MHRKQNIEICIKEQGRTNFKVNYDYRGTVQKQYNPKSECKVRVRVRVERVKSEQRSYFKNSNMCK